MSTQNLSITNVINVSVSTPPSGIADYQVNNLAIFTKEAPVNGAITAATPGLYRSPSAVLTDWGANSEVYAQALAIFSQSPNILDGSGQLIVFPMQVGDTLAGVIPTAQKTQFFHGALACGYDPVDAEYEAASAACESIRVLLFVSSPLSASLNGGGLFAVLAATVAKHTRMFLYTQGALTKNARVAVAAYAARLMSVDFNGSNTTNTMHLKQLATIAADSGITQAILDSMGTVGVDGYPSIAGRPSVWSTGANGYSDDIYDLDWLVLALEVAGFNALATTSTKLPQTENGIAVLRGAYIKVLQKAVTNQFLAPGDWNSPETFGNPVDLIRNIAQRGYYIYSQPISQQSQADRLARKAPLIQIAVKEAGAVHSSSVVVFVNA
jgi:Protein of unknown function (DUF3383)